MTAPDPFLHDDGPYVLGALSAAERAAFEGHLQTCAACAQRVRELEALPALLAGLAPSAFDDLDEAPPDTLLPGLLRRVRSARRRRQWLTSGLAGLAAACLVALAALTLPAGHSTTPGSGASRPVAMSAVVTSPVHATAALTDVAWGTQIRLTCSYDESRVPVVDYELMVIDKQGGHHTAGSWSLIPGKVIHFTGGTALPRDQIARIEITVRDHAILQLVP